jgi:hypothetical protein
LVVLKELENCEIWGWNGIESENPLIGENSGDDWHTTLIVDDEVIQVIYMDSAGFSDGRYITIKFPEKSVSLLFAMKIDLNEEPEVLEFIAQEMGGIVENIFNPQVGRV